MQIFRIVKQSLIQGWEDDSFTQSAAIAYYTLFSFPALLIVIMGLGSMFMDIADIEGAIYRYLTHTFGSSTRPPSATYY